SPFDFVRLYGHYWGGHKTNLCSLPIYTENEETEAFVEETPIENHEVTPPLIPHKMHNKTLKDYLSLAK
ncbi:lipopolysaccharide biosynthesis protein, partial [Helicobacter pylori]|nr:lipopolysaccharide biosynthesis protein [Helicobacter pylori]